MRSWPDGLSGPDMMGQRADWLAFIGQHDGSGNQSTVVFVDADRGARDPTQWFVRTEPYAMMGTAPFFDADVVVSTEKASALPVRWLSLRVWSSDDIEKYIAVHDLAHVTPVGSEDVE